MSFARQKKPPFSRYKYRHTIEPDHKNLRLGKDGVESPVASLARVHSGSGQLEEALVEGEVVSYGVFPAQVGQIPVVAKLLLINSGIQGKD